MCEQYTSSTTAAATEGQIESVSYLDRDGKTLDFSGTASFSEGEAHGHLSTT